MFKIKLNDADMSMDGLEGDYYSIPVGGNISYFLIDQVGGALSALIKGLPPVFLFQQSHAINYYICKTENPTDLQVGEIRRFLSGLQLQPRRFYFLTWESLTCLIYDLTTPIRIKGAESSTDLYFGLSMLLFRLEAKYYGEKIAAKFASYSDRFLGECIKVPEDLVSTEIVLEKSFFYEHLFFQSCLPSELELQKFTVLVWMRDKQFITKPGLCRAIKFLTYCLGKTHHVRLSETLDLGQVCLEHFLHNLARIYPEADKYAWRLGENDKITNIMMWIILLLMKKMSIHYERNQYGFSIELGNLALKFLNRIPEDLAHKEPVNPSKLVAAQLKGKKSNRKSKVKISRVASPSPDLKQLGLLNNGLLAKILLTFVLNAYHVAVLNEANFNDACQQTFHVAERIKKSRLLLNSRLLPPRFCDNDVTLKPTLEESKRFLVQQYQNILRSSRRIEALEKPKDCGKNRKPKREENKKSKFSSSLREKSSKKNYQLQETVPFEGLMNGLTVVRENLMYLDEMYPNWINIRYLQATLDLSAVDSYLECLHLPKKELMDEFEPVKFGLHTDEELSACFKIIEVAIEDFDAISEHYFSVILKHQRALLRVYKLARLRARIDSEGLNLSVAEEFKNQCVVVMNSLEQLDDLKHDKTKWLATFDAPDIYPIEDFKRFAQLVFQTNITDNAAKIRLRDCWMLLAEQFLMCRSFCYSPELVDYLLDCYDNFLRISVSVQVPLAGGAGMASDPEVKAQQAFLTAATNLRLASLFICSKEDFKALNKKQRREQLKNLEKARDHFAANGQKMALWASIVALVEFSLREMQYDKFKSNGDDIQQVKGGFVKCIDMFMKTSELASVLSINLGLKLDKRVTERSYSEHGAKWLFNLKRSLVEKNVLESFLEVIANTARVTRELLTEIIGIEISENCIESEACKTILQAKHMAKKSSDLIGLQESDFRKLTEVSSLRDPAWIVFDSFQLAFMCYDKLESVRNVLDHLVLKHQATLLDDKLWFYVKKCAMAPHCRVCSRSFLQVADSD